MTRQSVSVFPKVFGAFIFVLTAGFAFAATGDFADIPALKQRVTDTTATLSSAEEARIETVLRAFEQKKGSQIVVLIIPTTQPEAIEQYGIRVAEAWKLGRKGVDDGAILLVAKNDRKLRIEVGRGLEGVLPDAIAKRIIAETIAPRFRAGDYSGGILAGVEKMIAVVDGETLPPPPNKRVSSARTADFFSDFLPFALVAAFVVGGILRALLGRFLGASLTAGITGLAAFVLFGVLSTAVVSGIIVFVIVLLFGSGRGWSSGQGWSSGRWSSGGGGGSDGGGFSGGGGDFWRRRRVRRLVMNLKRIWRHILMSKIQVNRCFPESVLNSIQSAVQQSERTHRGEIRFVVEGELTWAQLLGDMTPRARALEVFSGLRVWDTEHNNGVLVYVLLADRIVEIVADRGIHLHAGDDVWREICKLMQAEFRAGRFEDGGVKGVAAISALLRKHFPADGENSNELPDKPLLI